MDWHLLFKPFLTGLSLGALVMYFLKGKIDDHFRRNAEVRADKRDLAKKILAIIAEAETSNYQLEARDREHVKNLALQVNPYNAKLDDKIRQYEFIWWLASDIHKRKNQPQENLFFYRELEVKAGEQANAIKKDLAKWLR